MTSPVAFLKEVQLELAKVEWPTRDQVVRLTMLVVIISLVVGLFLGAIDFLFVKIVEALL